MSVAQQSREAYETNQEEFIRQEDLVLSFIQGNPGHTRQQIAKRLKLSLSAVCGRVNKLKKLNLVEDENKYQTIKSRNGRQASRRAMIYPIGG